MSTYSSEEKDDDMFHQPANQFSDYVMKLVLRNLEFYSFKPTNVKSSLHKRCNDNGV